MACKGLEINVSHQPSSKLARFIWDYQKLPLISVSTFNFEPEEEVETFLGALKRKSLNQYCSNLSACTRVVLTDFKQRHKRT